MFLTGKETEKLLGDRFQQLKGWCPEHLWAPSCYHKTFKKKFDQKCFAISGTWMGGGGEVYIGAEGL